jgi:hypothetical protein
MQDFLKPPMHEALPYEQKPNSQHKAHDYLERD